MKREKICLDLRGKKVSLEVIKANKLQEVRGLMFRRLDKAEAMLFDFNKNVDLAIHSFFVFFPFLAVWLDDKNDVLELRKVRPFSFFIKPHKKYEKLVEIPLSKKYRSVWSLVGAERFKYNKQYKN